MQDAVLLLLSSISADGMVIDIDTSGVASEVTLDAIHTLVDLIEDSATFDDTTGNSKSYAYYSGVEAGNPSGNKNIQTITYAGTLTTVKTFTYDSVDDVLTLTIT